LKFKNLFSNLTFFSPSPPTICCDNQSTYKPSRNHGFFRTFWVLHGFRV
jgi:hypothetical protein